MSVAVLQKDFERLAKKQRTARSSRNAKLDSLLEELERAKAEIEAQGDPMEEDGKEGKTDEGRERQQGGASQDVQSILENLEASYKSSDIGDTLAAEHKELNNIITKFGKAVDRAMPPELERAIKPVPVDDSLLNRVIVEHLLRSGRVRLARSLASEAGVVLAEETVSPYEALFAIVLAIPQRDLRSALQWAEEHQDTLLARSSPLPFRLARMHFLQLVEEGRTEDAVQYARSTFPKFTWQHLAEVQKLMGTLIFAKRLAGSPYHSLFDPSEWDALSLLFKKESCEVLGLGHDLPLAVSVSAGVRALPSLLKFATVMQAKMGDWQRGSSSLAVEVELGPECRFHSVFVCPVSREQASKDNRPMIMQCGHVLCELSLRKLSRGGSRFKCPYCPAEVSLNSSMRLYL